MLCNSEGTVIGYASVAADSDGEDTWSLALPSDLTDGGTYTLKVFSEQQNGDKQTDYASTPEETGTAVITATSADGGFTYECSVSVVRRDYPADGSTETVIAASKIDVTDRLGAGAISGSKRFISRNKKIATVDSKGIVKGKSAGTVIIELQAKSGKQWKTVSSCEIKIEMPVMEKKRTVQMGAASLNASDFISGGTEFAPTSWKSSNPKVADVADDGAITLKKGGTASIIAEYGEAPNSSKKKYKTALKVRNPLINKAEITNLKVGKSKKLGIKGKAKGDLIEWTSGDPAVVTVDSSGKLTGVKYGTAEIRATVNGYNAGSCRVTVTD